MFFLFSNGKISHIGHLNHRLLLLGHCVHVHLFAVGVVEHAVHDVLGQLGLVRVGGSAHPGVDDALIVGALKWYLE